MFNKTTKANGILGANDRGAPMVGTEGAPVDVSDDDALDGNALVAAIRAGNFTWSL